MQAKIENSLLKNLLPEGEMHYALYEFELVEHIDYWKESLRKDKDDFIFIVTVNNGDVAMLLITNTDELFINEKARKQLKLFWKINYKTNIEMLLPSMVKDLSNDCFSITGVKIANQ